MPLMKMELTGCSETSSHNPDAEKHPKERTEHSEHGESFKTRIIR